MKTNFVIQDLETAKVYIIPETENDRKIITMAKSGELIEVESLKSDMDSLIMNTVLENGYSPIMLMIDIMNQDNSYLVEVAKN